MVSSRFAERMVRKEPWPWIALYSWAVKGFKTTPIVGMRFTVKPIEMAV